jgi:hypothetical protein
MIVVPVAGPSKIRGFTKSFHTHTLIKMATDAAAGRVNGKIIEKYVRKGPAPSMLADSSSSLGIVPMNRENKETYIADDQAQIRAQNTGRAECLSEGDEKHLRRDRKAEKKE